MTRKYAEVILKSPEIKTPAVNIPAPRKQVQYRNMPE
jgi:hypothetical protein